MIEPPNWLEVLNETAPRLVYRLPEVLLSLVGLVMAAWCWRWDRRTAILMALGSLLLLAAPLTFETGRVLMWLRPELFKLHPRRPQAGYPWLQLVCSCATALGILLLLLGAVLKRTPKLDVSWDVESEETAS
jgi:hypothetical protein